MTPEFHPWRRRVEFLPCEEAPVRPLIGELGFIRDKQRWGFPIRRGLFEVPQADFEQLAHAMQAEAESIRASGSAEPAVAGDEGPCTFLAVAVC